MAYFIEVTKMSGIRTYFGSKFSEIYKTKDKLSERDGFDNLYEAEANLIKVAEDCKNSGMAISKTEIISI